MLRFDVTAEEGTVARVKPVDRNAYMMPIDRFHCAIEDSLAVDVQTLTQLASTCTARLGRVAVRNVVAAPQQGSLQLRPPRLYPGGLACAFADARHQAGRGTDCAIMKKPRHWGH